MKFGMQEFFLTYIRGKGFVARDIVRKTWLHRQDEITRLTERNAELEAECELLAEDNDRAQQVITAHWHNLERERERADTLTDRNAELEAECERLKSPGAMGRLLEECEREQKRADQLQAKLDAAVGLPRFTVRSAIGGCELTPMPEEGPLVRYSELQQALNGSHEVTGPNIYTDSQQALKGE